MTQLPPEPSPDHAPDLAKLLSDLLREHGPGLIETRSRLLTMLRERAPGEFRAVHLLMTALDAGVPARLSAGDGPLEERQVVQETAQIVDNFGASPDYARAAVETWAAALGLATPRPLATPPSPVRPLPAAQPLPGPPAESAAAVRPLPTPIRPLPASGPAVRPLPGAEPPLRPLPLPGQRPAASAQPPSRGRWVAALAVVAILGGGIWAALKVPPFGSTPTKDLPPKDPPPKDLPPKDLPPKDPPPKDVPKVGPGSGPSASGRTDEGFEVVTPDRRPRFKVQRLDGNANTLLFPFGLRVGGEAYTYQVAVAFEGRSRDGVGLLKVVKKGVESSTGQVQVARSLQDNGYLGFTVSGKLQGSVSAPSICVSALGGKDDAKFDLANGGGLFCAFGTRPDGLCDGDVRHGCGDLEE